MGSRYSRHAQLRPDTDPAAVESWLAAAGLPFRLQFDEPLPADVLSAAAEALRRHPDVELRAYGRRVDPGLTWLDGFSHVRHLSVELWHLTDFGPLAQLRGLRTLKLGQTKSRRPDLAVLGDLIGLEDLWIEGHEKGFATIARLPRLRRLGLRVPKVRTLEPLAGHPAIEVIDMSFGGVRDLAPLCELPGLRGLGLHQVRGLTTADLDVLSGCTGLEAVSLGALRNVTGLGGLAGSATTLRQLVLERIGLESLADVRSLVALEGLGIYDMRPADRRLDHLLACGALVHLVASQPYPEDQIAALRDGFRGSVLVLRDGSGWGDLDAVDVRWRASVDALLGVPRRSAEGSRRIWGDHSGAVGPAFDAPPDDFQQYR